MALSPSRSLSPVRGGLAIATGAVTCSNSQGLTLNSASASERAYVAAVCDNAADALDRFQAEANAQILAIKEEWNSSAAHQNAPVESATRQRQEDNLAWLRSHAMTEPAPTDTRDIRQQGAFVLEANPVSSGAGSAGPAAPDPRQLELARAQAIKDMSLEEFARLRTDLGVRSSTDMSHLFGREPRR